MTVYQKRWAIYKQDDRFYKRYVDVQKPRSEQVYEA